MEEADRDRYKQIFDEGEPVGCWLFVPHHNVNHRVTEVKIMSGVGEHESPDFQIPKVTHNSKAV